MNGERGQLHMVVSLPTRQRVTCLSPHPPLPTRVYVVYQAVPVLEAMGTHSESPELAVAVVHYLDNMSDADDNKAPLFTAACRVVVELLSSFGSCSSLPWSVRVAVCALALQPVPVPVAVCVHVFAGVCVVRVPTSQWSHQSRNISRMVSRRLRAPGPAQSSREFPHLPKPCRNLNRTEPCHPVQKGN